MLLVERTSDMLKHEQLLVHAVCNGWGKYDGDNEIIWLHFEPNNERKRHFSAVLQLLLNNNADILQFDVDGQTPLHLCCKYNITDGVSMLLTETSNINIPNIKGQSPLYLACEEGYISVTNMLLQNNADIFYSDEDGVTPLHIAFEKKRWGVLEILLDKKTDVNKLHKDAKEVLLCTACSVGHIDTVRDILSGNNISSNLEENANINVVYSQGCSPLYLACKKGNKEVVDILVDNKGDVRNCDLERRSPLYVACVRGFYNIVRILILNNADISQCDSNEISPLHVAFMFWSISLIKNEENCELNISLMEDKTPIKKILGDFCSFSNDFLQTLNSDNYEPIIQLLLNNKADISKCDYKGNTPLHTCCKYGNKEGVRFLLRKGADVNILDNDGRSAFFIACEGGYLDIVNELVKGNIDPSKFWTNAMSPIHAVCKARNHWRDSYISLLKLLVDNTHDISQQDDSGQTPLHVCCKYGNTEAAGILIENNINVNKLDKDNRTPLYIACMHRRENVAKLLLKNKADISIGDNDGQTPLLIACKIGSYSLIKLLLSNNADISKCDKFQRSALLKACENGHVNTVKFLLQNKADISKCDVNGISPLHMVCIKWPAYYNIRKCRSLMQILIANGAALSQVTAKGNTPLHVSSEYGNVEAAKILIKNKADVNICNNSGQSPLHLACQEGCAEVVKLLLTNGAVIDLNDKKGKTPLFVICEFWGLYCLFKNSCNENDEDELPEKPPREYTSAAKLLICDQKDIVQRDDNGQTLLHVCCLYNNIQAINLLLEKKAGVNLCDNEGKTPLYLASENGHKETVELLLKYNADFSICDDKKISPIDALCLSWRRKPKELVDPCASVSLYANFKAVFDLLQKKDVGILKKDHKSETDLHVCSKYGKVGDVRVAYDHDGDKCKSKIGGINEGRMRRRTL